VRVPDDLRARVGMLEVKRSLGVHDISSARRLSLACAARLMETFEMLRTDALDTQAIRSLVRNCFADLAKIVEPGFTSTTSRPDLEIAEVATHSNGRLAELSDQIAVGLYDRTVCKTAALAVANAGYDPSQQPEPVRAGVKNGVARALAEQERLFLFRLGERLLEYRPIDPLFEETAALAQPPVNGATGGLPVAEKMVVGPTLEELVSTYLAAKKKTWAPKTYVGRKRQLGYLVEFLGSDTRAASVRPDQVRDYRDALQKLRRNHHQGQPASFTSRLTDNADQRIDARTVANLFETARAMFRWAVSDAYISQSPAAGIQLVQGKTKKGIRSRRPFSALELVKLFSTPVHQGSRSFSDRFNPGTQIIWDARYWIPILGLLTGMRLGELVQLHLADIELEGPVPFISITEANGGAVGSGLEKFVKSDAGIRTVPLHPHLIELGFDQFVRERRMKKNTSGRLFFEVSFGADGMPSTVFSKWFGRFLDKAGLDDPALVFHSFRHGAEDAFREALHPQYVIDQIVGHADGTTSSLYGEGVGLEVQYAAIKSMVLKIDLTKVLAKKSGHAFTANS
jgi:integrase